ncbi:MAG: hypothetical protein IIC60_09495 [Proteobacteria bacterium]|nr:hypothetical protein [Pseudomonadota bacterium]
MANYLTRSSAVLLLLCAQTGISAEYPNMEGQWVGHIRVVTSGTSETGQVSSGGAIISESELVFTVDYQDGATFIGRSRSSNASGSTAGVSVYGSIRSNGKEAMFVTSTGGNGLIWFENPTAFEYCYTNLSENTATAYCAKLSKKE